MVKRVSSFRFITLAILSFHFAICRFIETLAQIPLFDLFGANDKTYN